MDNIQDQIIRDYYNLLKKKKSIQEDYTSQRQSKILPDVNIEPKKQKRTLDEVLKPKPIKKVGLMDFLKNPLKASYDLGVSIIGARPVDIAREGLNIMAEGEIGAGQAIGDAIASVLQGKKLSKAQQSLVKSGETFLKMALEEKDQERKKNLLKQGVESLQLAGNIWKDVLPTLQRTNKQILADFAETGLDVATSGVYKGGKTLFKTNKLGKALTEVGKGAAIGAGQDIIHSVREKNEPSLGLGTVLGTLIPAGFEYSKYTKTIDRLGEAIDKYRNALNLYKTDFNKIEVKNKKSMDDIVKFLLANETPVKSTKEGKIDTLEALEKLREKSKQLNSKLEQVLDDSIPRHNIDEIKQQVLERIKDKNPTIEKEKLRNLDIFINDIKEKYGDKLTDKQLHNLKQGMWQVGFEVNNRTKSPVARQLGNIMKEELEKKVDDINVKKANELSSMYAISEKLLENLHGRPVKGGRLGGMFNRLITGAIFDGLLNKVPVLNRISIPLGVFISKHYDDFINNPEKVVKEAIIQARKSKLKPQDKKVLDELEKALNNKKKVKETFNKIIKTKLLKQPPIITPPPK